MTKTSLQSRVPRTPRALADTAIREARKFLVRFLYLWALFALFALYKSVLLPEEGLIYGQGFAVLNAFVLAKVMLIGDNLHLGENFDTRPLIYPVLFKSALFAIILICFDLIEEVVMRNLRGEALAAGVWSSSLKGILSVGIIIFVVLIPYFAFREMAKVVGERQMRELLFVRRTELGAVSSQGGRPQ
jgi:hypothetical protein